MITRNLIQTVLQQFPLIPTGEHGVVHWARVLENGRRLAPLTGANLRVVELFAVLHDSQRMSDDSDPLHGIRASRYCITLREAAFKLADHEFALLFEACAFHADGRIQGDVTVRTCWDADRLDYGRGGTLPDPRLLCTDAAKEPGMLAWATDRSCSQAVPGLVYADWGCELAL